jgi:transposase-like protein
MRTEKAANKDELNLIKLAQQYSDEDKAHGLLESLRWPGGVTCPHCKALGSECKDVYRLEPKPTSKRPGRKGLFCCAACRKQFSVTVGTVFEGSHIPISKWLMAMFIICSSKKSISAHQLHRMLDITYKTAWFMAHRIRFAMGPEDKPEKLKGTVEVDETFIGGKGEVRTRHERHTPVVALIERDGEMRTAIVSNITQHNLRKIVTETVSKEAILNTDDSMIYNRQYKDYRRHDSVNHLKKEYIRRNPDGSISGVNSCESFFSLLKRGVVGSWHHVSKEHLPKYANEFAFRWNHRKTTDGERMRKFIPMIEGKRLTYRKAA